MKILKENISFNQVDSLSIHDYGMNYKTYNRGVMKIIEATWTIKSLAKKMDDLGINGQYDIRKVSGHIEVEFNKFGALDEEDFKKDVEKFQKLVGGWGGYRTGYGGWVYSETYAPDGKDYGDKSSRIHY